MASTHPLRFFIVSISMFTFLVGCVASPSMPSPSPRPVAETPPANKLELEKYFQDFTGAFVLYDLNNDSYMRYNSEQCAARLLPASTFKILNSLIGLETGVIPDENYVIKWDGTRFENSAWNQDHTLKTAFQNSVVWYYQELARRVGKERMRHYVNAVGYGNQDISGDIDSFWLNGAIRISADEQVELLKRLYKGDLPFSERSMKIVREIMIMENDPSHRLSGKTGSGQVSTTSIGWFVGSVEARDNVYFFATNIERSGPSANGLKAKEITRSILQDLELLP